MPFGLGGLGAALPKSKRAQKVDEADAIRVEGNEKFAKGDYLGAIAAYDAALKLNGSDASAHANKAECYLRARVFEKALECATRALERAKGDKAMELKAIYKKSMALNGMARYVDAAKTADEGSRLADAPEDAAVRATLEKVKLECEMLTAQAFTGAYDLGALYLNRMGASFRRCADYIGAVRVSKLSDGRRGLVTTSAVAAGDLLMVQSPLSSASFGKTVEQNLVRGLYEAARAHPADWAILKALPTSSEDEQKDAPEMSVFRKHISAANKENAPAPESPEELAFIPKVVANCAISGRRLCGVWPLPSFINHSCAPNCHRINVGQIMLVFASQNLPAGAEITMKYYDTLMPKKDRDAFANRRGYAVQLRAMRFRVHGRRERGKERPPRRKKTTRAPGRLRARSTGSSASSSPCSRNFKEELAEMKKTKGKAVPNVNPLIELRGWYESRLAALNLSRAQLAMARMSCYSMYESLSLALSVTGAGEMKHALVKTIIEDLSVVDAGGFAACKQSTMLANNARRTFGKDSREVVDATNVMVETHCLRYGAIGGEDLIEIVRRTEQSIAEETGEFCEL